MAILNRDQTAIQKFVKNFADREIAPKAAYYDKSEEFPWENIRKMGPAGLLGMIISEEYGGGGADTLSYILAIEELARACASTAAIMAIHSSAGALPVELFGTAEQKRAYLPDLASGAKLGAFALTEPGAGSDAARVSTTALRQGDAYVLNGTKCFISNGGVSGLYIIFATLDKAKGLRGITAFLVEGGNPGLRIGKKEEKMGIRASSTTEVILENCVVPASAMLGREGEGFKIAMQVLDGARIGVGAQAVGIARGAYEAALEYSRRREQFGKPISVNQGVSFMLADMAIQIEAARQLVHQAAQLKDAGRPVTKEAAMAKTFASDMAVQVALDAIQIMSGYGYSRECPVERMLRDAKVTQIYEGTNQILRLVVGKQILG